MCEITIHLKNSETQHKSVILIPSGQYDLPYMEILDIQIRAQIRDLIQTYRKPEPKPPFPVKIGDIVFCADEEDWIIGILDQIDTASEGLPFCVNGEWYKRIKPLTNIHDIPKIYNTYKRDGEITAGDLDKYDISEVTI